MKLGAESGEGLHLVLSLLLSWCMYEPPAQDSHLLSRGASRPFP